MKAEESSDDEAEHAGKDVSRDDKEGHGVGESISLEHCLNDSMRCECYHVAGHRSVKEHTDKILVVVETYAVGNPRAMVVHFQYALIALAAMVTAIRFAFQAPLAHANTTFIFPFNRLEKYSTADLSM